MKNTVLTATCLEGGVAERELRETDDITCFAIKDDITIIALKNLMLKTYKNNTLLKQYKVHEAAVLVMDMNASLLATGSADSTVKCWDVLKGHCTHNFKGHSGIVSLVKFHPDQKRGLLVSASDDCKIRLWDLFGKT
jgi:U3 small nucleolar RNA-associated protein 13